MFVQTCPHQLSWHLSCLLVGLSLLALCHWILGRFSNFNHLLLSYLHLCPKEQKAQLCLDQKKDVNLGSCEVITLAQCSRDWKPGGCGPPLQWRRGIWTRTLRCRSADWQADYGGDGTCRRQVGLIAWEMLRAKTGRGLG